MTRNMDSLLHTMLLLFQPFSLPAPLRCRRWRAATAAAPDGPNVSISLFHALLELVCTIGKPKLDFFSLQFNPTSRLPTAPRQSVPTAATPTFEVSAPPAPPDLYPSL